MSASDRISNKAEDLKGKVKETYGKTTGDSEAQASGASDQMKASGKEKFEDAKSAVADGVSKVKDKFTGDN